VTTGKYAAGTDVPSDRSRTEIERTLIRYGATNFIYGWEKDRVVIAFTAEGRQVRFLVPMPDPGDDEFTLTPTRKRRSPTEAAKAYEQAVRQRWRALSMLVKADLEAVALGVVTFEDRFLAHIVMPDGRTVADMVRSGVDEAYRTGQVRELLPATPRALGPGAGGR
jgi:hypothetical protein